MGVGARGYQEGGGVRGPGRHQVQGRHQVRVDAGAQGWPFGPRRSFGPRRGAGTRATRGRRHQVRVDAGAVARGTPGRPEAPEAVGKAPERGGVAQ